MGNTTKNKLKGTPFNSGEELKTAQSEILEETWRQLEKARVRKELTQKEEYRFFVETFEKGMVCKFGEEDDNLVRVSIALDGTINISISKSQRSKENGDPLLSVLIESMSSSFLSNYLKAMGILGVESIEAKESLLQMQSKRKKKP